MKHNTALLPAITRAQPDSKPAMALGKCRAIHAVSTDWLARHGVAQGAPIGIIEAVGDCMEPVIADGSLIAIDGTAMPEPGREDVFVLEHNGTIFVKRVRISGAMATLSMDNDCRFTKLVPAMQLGRELRVAGRVFWTSTETEIGRTFADLAKR